MKLSVMLYTNGINPSVKNFRSFTNSINHWQNNIDFWPIVLIYRLTIFFLLTTINLINVFFVNQLTILIQLIFLAINTHLCLWPSPTFSWTHRGKMLGPQASFSAWVRGKSQQRQHHRSRGYGEPSGCYFWQGILRIFCFIAMKQSGGEKRSGQAPDRMTLCMAGPDEGNLNKSHPSLLFYLLFSSPQLLILCSAEIFAYCTLFLSSHPYIGTWTFS